MSDYDTWSDENQSMFGLLDGKLEKFVTKMVWESENFN